MTGKVYGLMPFISGATDQESEYIKKLVKERDDYIESKRGRSELAAIRHWLEHQKYLPKVSDEVIILFLHSCAFSVERLKYTLDTYFTIRTHTPEVFSYKGKVEDLVAPLKKIIKVAVIPHEYQTPDNCRVVFAQVRNIPASEFHFVDCARTAVAAFDIEAAQAPPFHGLRAVIDFTGFHYSFLTRFNLSVMKQLMIYVQRGLPIYWEAVHVVNANSVVSQLMSLLEPFLEPRLRHKIQIFTVNESHKVFDVVPKSCTPCDMGGELQSMDYYNDQLCARLEQVPSWLETLEDHKVDENLRPEKSKDMFGIQGSFKKLEID